MNVDGVTLSKGSAVRFGTDRQDFSLVTGRQLVLNDFDIAFADIVKSDMYYWYGVHVGGSLPGSTYYYEEAISLISAIPQEWGPGRAHNIDDVLVGTVPIGTDFISVKANLARTKDPSLRLTGTINPLLPPGSGDWINFGSGVSCIIEDTIPLKRKFGFILDGTNVYLRRFMSVTHETYTEDVTSFWTSGNAANITGWTYGANGKGIGMSLRDTYPYQYNGSGTQWFRQRTQSGHIAYDDNTDYSSTYTGTVIITPGTFGAAV